ncbi:hypothetical protein BJV82DRAFT_316236 [Fennellomyces sp. T-0311]|nr:hypothetical protein BJV82DRAFT_316236 [Fennellomyces sp. T-0311]
MPVYSFNEILEPNKKQTQLDTVVTVENCYYYMSLLCSFYELERSMTSRAFSLFLAAAEKRYIEFMCSCHTENSWDGISHVPLYIAYAWHAHLLSPFRYYEDVGCGSNGPSEHLKLTDNFPLKEMHLKRTRDKPGDARLAYIAKQFSGAQSPTPAEKGYRSPYLRCNSCSEKLFFNS